VWGSGKRSSTGCHEGINDGVDNREGLLSDGGRGRGYRGGGCIIRRFRLLLGTLGPLRAAEGDGNEASDPGVKRVQSKVGRGRGLGEGCERSEDEIC